jgi:hypothetical protein
MWLPGLILPADDAAPRTWGVRIGPVIGGQPLKLAVDCSSIRSS